MGKDFTAKGIINLRNKRTGQVMRQEDYMDLFLVQVEPLESIPNNNFFIDKVGLCEKKWREFIIKDRKIGSEDRE